MDDIQLNLLFTSELFCVWIATVSFDIPPTTQTDTKPPSSGMLCNGEVKVGAVCDQYYSHVK